MQDKGRRKVPEGYIDLKGSIGEAWQRETRRQRLCQAQGRSIAYVFTSGTTGGMPKAAVILHRRLVSCAYYNGRIVLNMKPTDTMYVPLPFFHTNALALSWPTVFLNGSALAIRRKFSVSNFWDDVRKYNATAWCYIGELCRYLMNQPAQAGRRLNPLTKVIGNGLRPDIWQCVQKAFQHQKSISRYTVLLSRTSIS